MHKKPLEVAIQIDEATGNVSIIPQGTVNGTETGRFNAEERIGQTVHCCTLHPSLNVLLSAPPDARRALCEISPMIPMDLLQEYVPEKLAAFLISPIMLSHSRGATALIVALSLLRAEIRTVYSCSTPSCNSCFTDVVFRDSNGAPSVGASFRNKCFHNMLRLVYCLHMEGDLHDNLTKTFGDPLEGGGQCQR